MTPHWVWSQISKRIGKRPSECFSLEETQHHTYPSQENSMTHKHEKSGKKSAGRKSNDATIGKARGVSSRSGFKRRGLNAFGNHRGRTAPKTIGKWVPLCYLRSCHYRADNRLRHNSGCLKSDDGRSRTLRSGRDCRLRSACVEMTGVYTLARPKGT